MFLPVPKTIPDVGPGGPLVTSMGAMNALAHNMLKTKYYAPDIQSQINNRNALTDRYKTMTPLEANALALKNQYYAPNIQSEIDNRNASTNKTNTMTPLEAKELQLKNEWYPKTEQANINWKKSGGSGGGTGQKELMGFQNQLSNEHPEWSPEQVNQAASAYITGETQLSDGTQLPPISGLAQSYVDQIIKRGTTAQGLNQQRFAATADATLDAAEKLIPSISRYVGAIGKTNGTIDAIKSSLGVNTPAYNDYMYFTRNVVPVVAGEIMRALGANASDNQKKLYMDAVNPVAWDSNPKAALENFKRFKSLFKDTVSKTVGKSTGEIRSSLRASGKPEKYEVDYNMPSGSVGMIDPQGRLNFIPSNEVKKYIEKGYRYDHSGE